MANDPLLSPSTPSRSRVFPRFLYPVKQIKVAFPLNFYSNYFHWSYTAGAACLKAGYLNTGLHTLKFKEIFPVAGLQT